MNSQLAAQDEARRSPPKAWHPYRIAHTDGRITNHRTFTAAEKAWRFGDVLYQWHHSRWAIWTSAGLA
jgi:hypothetical protein